jgi:hypothetical protein
LEDAEDYKAFEAAITADYDAQSAVERELVLRLASLLWRLRRATTIETGLFEIQAKHFSAFRKVRQISPASREIVYALFNTNSARQVGSPGLANLIETNQAPGPASMQSQVVPDVKLARCFLRLLTNPDFIDLTNPIFREVFPHTRFGAGERALCAWNPLSEGNPLNACSHGSSAPRLLPKRTKWFSNPAR